MKMAWNVCRAAQYLFWPKGRVDYLEARVLTKVMEKTAIVFAAGAVVTFFMPFMQSLLLGCGLVCLLLSWGLGLKYR